MILSKERKIEGKPEIDLTGPEGNVFVLMGYAKKWADQLGLDAQAIVNDMKSGTYAHAIEVLEKYFGEHVIFYR